MFLQLCGVPIALDAYKVITIDVGTDIWTAIAFALQPAESNLMAEQPRHPRKHRLVDASMVWFCFGYVGMMQSVLCWWFFLSMPHMLELTQGQYVDLSLKENQELSDAHLRAMTMYYWTLVMGQVGAAIATTTSRQSIFQYGLPNMLLNVLLVSEVVLAVFVIYSPLMNDRLKTLPLESADLWKGALAMPIIVGADEVRKLCLRC